MSFAFKNPRRDNFRGRGHNRGRGGHNRGGRIAPYTKDGGRKAQDKGGTDFGPKKFKSRASFPTMDQIQSDRLTQYAQKYWSPQTAKQHLDFSQDVIEDIYKVDLNIGKKHVF